MTTLLRIFVHQAKEIGARYKAFTPEEKAKWQAKADKAKEVYKEQMAEYLKTKPKDSPSPKKSESKKKKKPEPEPSESEDSDDDSSDDSDSD